jgi:hypothetical protein
MQKRRFPPTDAGGAERGVRASEDEENAITAPSLYPG